MSQEKPYGLLILLVPVLYYGVQAALRTAPTGEALIIAHRGGPKYAPENTLSAFRNAIEQGADAIELDVQQTSDGALVVMHDTTVDRTTDGTGAVSELALEEIHRLDAGEGEPVPTLREVIDVAKAGGVRMLPEAKSPAQYPGMAEMILQELREAEFLDQAIIQSFDAEALKALRTADESAQLCALYGMWGFDMSAPAGDAQNVCPMGEMALLYPGMIRQAHGEGRRVYVWFLALESPATMKVLRFFGADGFMVDDPAAAIQALGR